MGKCIHANRTDVVVESFGRVAQLCMDCYDQLPEDYDVGVDILSSDTNLYQCPGCGSLGHTLYLRNHQYRCITCLQLGT